MSQQDILEDVINNQNQIDCMGIEISRLNKELKKIQNRHENLLDNNKKVQETYEVLKQENSVLKNANIILKEEISSLKTITNNRDKYIEELLQKNATCEEQSLNCRQNISSLMSSINQYKTNAERYEKLYLETNKENNSMKSTLKDIRYHISKQKSRYKCEYIYTPEMYSESIFMFIKQQNMYTDQVKNKIDDNKNFVRAHVLRFKEEIKAIILSRSTSTLTDCKSNQQARREKNQIESVFCIAGDEIYVDKLKSMIPNIVRLHR